MHLRDTPETCDMTYTEAALKFLTDRGIGEDVAAVRLVGYKKGDIRKLADGTYESDVIFAADPQMREVASKAKWRADISDGILIVKHPVPLPDLGPIIGQFRPFGKKRKQTFPHDHAMYTPTVRGLHIRSPKWEHDGDDPKGEHEHTEFYGKYMMMRGPREMYPSVHDVDKLAAKMFARGTARTEAHAVQLAEVAWRDHMHKKPHGDDADRLHWHEGRNPDPDQHPEKRLDMNPLSVDSLATARRVFFSIEGSIKGDAIVSAGFPSHSEVAFSVPSVTMWRVPELEDFATKFLADTAVFVVPDADWADNPNVALQAFECRDALRGYVGPNVHVAAAPSGGVKGVDDFLGSGGKVDDLVVLEREMSNGFLTWKFRHIAAAKRRRGRGVEAAENDAAVLEWMALHASADGVVLKAAPIIAKYTGLSEDTVGRSVTRLVMAGALESNATPQMLTVRARYIRVKREGKLRRRPLHTGESWDPRNEFTVADHLRAVDRPQRTVVDVAP
jgi:hypothetical protein